MHACTGLQMVPWLLVMITMLSTASSFMYPNRLLSQHFWTEEQKQQFVESTFAARMGHFKSLAVQIRNSGSHEEVKLLEELSKQVRGIFIQTGDWLTRCMF